MPTGLSFVNRFITVLFITTLLSCSNHFKDSAQNRQQKKINDVTLTLTALKPESLAAINYGEALERMRSEQKDSVMLEYQSYSCFIFDIDIDGFSGTLSDYRPSGSNYRETEIAQFYASDLQSHLSLEVKNGEPLPCEVFFAEKSNGLPGRTRLIAGFRTEGRIPLVFKFNNPYLNCGTIQFNINRDQI